MVLSVLSNLESGEEKNQKKKKGGGQNKATSELSLK